MKHLRYLIDWTNPKISTLFSAWIRFSCVCMVTNVPVRPTPALQGNCMVMYLCNEFITITLFTLTIIQLATMTVYMDYKL